MNKRSIKKRRYHISPKKKSCRRQSLAGKRKSYEKQFMLPYGTSTYPRVTTPKVNVRRPTSPIPITEQARPLKRKYRRKRKTHFSRSLLKPTISCNKKKCHVSSKKNLNPTFSDKRTTFPQLRNKIANPLDLINFHVNKPKFNKRRPNSVPKKKGPYQKNNVFLTSFTTKDNSEMISFRKRKVSNKTQSHLLSRYRNKPVTMVVEMKPYTQVSPCMPRRYCKPNIKNQSKNN